MTRDSQEINELALPPGFELGNYIIRLVIGQGGFGITYLAYDRILQTEVVIKENMPTTFAGRSAETQYVVPLANATEDFEWATERFLQEARTMAKLKHRNIVSVTRVFKALGTAYYVMPYVGGSALDKVLEKEGPLPEERLRPLLYSLLDALQYLHSKELLHRDIKPANILLDGEGQPILIDFGAARQLSQHSQTVVGSPGYTPFEQMQTHGEIGPWTDIYALGGTMYKLITGQTPMRCMDRIGKDTQAPLADREELSSRYSRAFLKGIDKALAFDASKRWQTAEEWQQSLNADLRASSRPHSLPSPTLLIEAAADGQEDVVRLLLEKGADIDAKNDDGATPLLLAAGNGHEAVVQLLLEKGANIEAKNHYCDTPLIEAARFGNETIVRLLWEKGADIDAKNDYGNTPLIAAADNGHEDVVRLLLKKGANIEAKNNVGDTSLRIATEKGHEAIVRLLAKGAPRRKRINFIAAAVFFVFIWLIKFHRDDLKCCLDGSLMHYAGINNVSMTYLLLTIGANIEGKDDGGGTPLIEAARGGNEAVVRLLLEKGANIEAKFDGWTPLIVAVANGHEAVVRLLLEKGANIDAKNYNGNTPLIWATVHGHEAVVRLLLEKGANIDAKNDDGNTPLILAASYGNETIVRLLLEKGADIDAKDNDDNTPLILAAQEGHEAVVRLLLEKGANVDARNIYGRTAYDLAQADSIKRLLRSYQR